MDDSPLAAWLREAEAAPTASGHPPQQESGEEPPAEEREVLWQETAWRDREAPPTRRLLLLAAVPWLLLAVVAVVALVGTTGRRGSPPPPSAAVPADPPHQAGVGPDREQAPVGLSDTATEPSATGSGPASASGGVVASGRAGATAAPGATDAAGASNAPGAMTPAGATAAMAVTATLTKLTPGRQRYVDDVAVESAASTGPVTVVTVRALVLDGSGGVWSSARVRRYAVAVGPAPGGLAALAPPWPLVVASPEATAWRSVDDDELRSAAAAALRRAGWSRVSPPRLQRSASWPDVLRSRMTAVAPQETRPRRHEVWLADGPVPEPLPLAGGSAP